MGSQILARYAVQIDLALAGVLIVVGEVGIWGGFEHAGPKAIAAPTTFLIAATLAVRRRNPVTLSVVFLLVSVVQVAAGHALDSLWALVVLIAVAYSTSAYTDRRDAVLAGAVVLAGTYVSQIADPTSATSDKVLAPLVLVGAPWLAGRLVQRYGSQARQLERLNARLAHSHAADLTRAVEQERARIAHELHDVIAHSISVMVVQAGAAEQLPVDADALEALQSIRRTGKSALGEMRRLLGVLRTEPEAGEDLHPQPGIAELHGMVERMRGAGLEVTLELAPGLPQLQPGPDLVVFRVVQEALTNTLKHASGAASRVRVGFDGHAIRIEARDGGGTPRPERAQGTGHGLVGMRERLALYGGTLESGPADGGGWRIDARLPVGPEALR